MTEKKDVTNTAGLRGVTAGRTAICSCGVEGMGLNYRGYDILELAEESTFEEVAYLLLRGELPKRKQLEVFKNQLARLRDLPQELKDVLERIPKATHPMDVMRTGCSMLGTLEPEADFKEQQQVADRLLAAFPSILMYWHQFVTHGKRIDTVTDDDTLAGHLLHLLHGKRPRELHRRAMDVSLILYAEHEFNASTFAVRVATATLSDFYSAITAGIGTLRGPLHGGANEAAMALISRFKTPAEASKGVHAMLARRHQGMGAGTRRGRRQRGAVPGLGGDRAGDVGPEEAIPQPGFLLGDQLPPDGRAHPALHAALCLLPHHRLVRAPHGTARRQPPDPAERRVHRPAAAGVCGD